MMRIVREVCWLALFALPMSVSALEFSGAGSSAAAPLYQKWSGGFQKDSGHLLRYEAVGSAKGIEAAKARRVDFGATDVAPSAAELAKTGLVLLPTAITGVVPVVNLPGIKPGQLKLSGEVLARIMMARITQWNDPAIAALNEGMRLPAKPIVVVTRSDGSGTTYNLSDYLSAASREWKESLGTGFTIKWPAATSVKGTDAVVSTVKSTDGAIACVDYAYVIENGLSDVRLQNVDGKAVKAEAASFTEALMNSTWPSKGDFEDRLVAKHGAGSWPITMGTFVVLPRVADNAARTGAAANFLIWGFMRGDKLANSLAFVRLPDAVQAKATNALGSMRDKSGQALPLRFF
ncbi:phosphate ABC transporter substrate-binding protein PstS [Chitinivorax sp. PXF-14]|uniref:phosphate ABC transporter substrate-binding protein PstS n=1 Tax=Chitinivorax sp. PXF-14 TaxID=3230488 RepID=UPI003465CB37